MTWLNSPWVWLGGFVGSVAIVALLDWQMNLSAVVSDRLKRIGRGIGNTFMPFRVIAAELRRMNDLKELELSERINPHTGLKEPVVPITEVPGHSDTEVFWGVEPKADGVEAMRRNWQRDVEAAIAQDDIDDDMPYT